MTLPAKERLLLFLTCKKFGRVPQNKKWCYKLAPLQQILKTILLITVEVSWEIRFVMMK